MKRIKQFNKLISKLKEKANILIRDLPFFKEELEIRAKLQERIDSLEEKWKDIPLFICFMCKTPIKNNGGGYVEYMHKYFHNNCDEEYRRITEIKHSYNSYKGHPIKHHEK